MAQGRLWEQPGEWRRQHAWAVPIVRRLQRAATADGDELGPSWFEQAAQRREWSTATRDLYARAARLAGYAIEAVAAPGPWSGPRSFPLLWELGEQPSGATLRAAAWTRLAAGWPAAVDSWHHLDDDRIVLEGDDAFIDGRRVLGGAGAWRAWRAWRQEHLGDHDDGAALVTLRAANRAQLAGQRLSVRGMQDAFSKAAGRAAAIARSLAGSAHARGDPAAAARRRSEADAYDRLSYDSYRRLLLEAGARPVDPRGAVRAGQAAPARGAG